MSVDTPIVVPESDEQGFTYRPGKRTVGWIVASIILFGVVLASIVIEIPYFALEPGDTHETEEVLIVDGTATFPNPDGEVRFVTVTRRRLTPLTWLLAKFDDTNQIVHEDLILGGRTREEEQEESAQLMVSSQNAAVIAALGELGVNTDVPSGVVIVDPIADGPFDGELVRNDVIRRIGSSDVATLGDLEQAIAELETGEEATLGVLTREGEALDVAVEVGSETAATLGITILVSDDREGAVVNEVGPDTETGIEPGDMITMFNDEVVSSPNALITAIRALNPGEVVSVEVIGENGARRIEKILLSEREVGPLERIGLLGGATQFQDPVLPFEVSIGVEGVGGPSAGMAFALSIIDLLTEGDLTGGEQVAVTGTVTRNGEVGPIGGVVQKVHAAKADGISLFIVPDLNLAEALDAEVDGLRIESVSNLAEALDLLESTGGDAVEEGSFAAGG